MQSQPQVFIAIKQLESTVLRKEKYKREGRQGPLVTMSAFTALNGGSPKPTDNPPSTTEKASVPDEAPTTHSQSAAPRDPSPRRRESWNDQAPDHQPSQQPRQYSEADSSHKRKRSDSMERRREAPIQERTPDTATTPSKPLPHDYYTSPTKATREIQDERRWSANQGREERKPLESQKGQDDRSHREESAEDHSRRSHRPSEPGEEPNQSSDAEGGSITVYAYPNDPRQDNILQHDPKKRKRNFSNRTKTGCLTCRKRKKKCDEEKPECELKFAKYSHATLLTTIGTNCIRGGFVCAGYPPQRGASWQKPDSKTPAVPLESKDPSYIPPGAYGMPQPGSYTSQNSYSAHGPKRDPLPHYRGGALRIDPPQGRPLVTDDDRQTASTILSSSVASPDNKLSAVSYNTSATAFPTPISANTQPPPFGERMTKEYQRVPPLHDLSRQEPESQQPGQLPQINILHPTRTSSPASQHPSSSAQVAQLALSHSFPQHRTQKEEMLLGRHYYPFDKELCLERERCATACWRFNNLTSPATIGVSPEERARLFLEILAPRDPVRIAPNEISPVTNIGRVGRHVAVETPFTCDYGYNITIGNTVSIGRNCTINDVCEVKIGDNCVIGPNVSIFTATLPIDPKKRQGGQGPQLGRPITIEPDCWIGGGAMILPGRTIGKGSTVGAGSIVTKVCGLSLNFD